MPGLHRSASAPELKSESSSPTGQGEVDMFRLETTKGKGKQPEKQRVEHGDNVASSSTTGQEEFDLLRRTTKGKHLENHPVEHGDNVASSSTTGQRKKFDLLEALDKEEKERWSDQGTKSRDVSPRGDQGTRSRESEGIEMSSLARLSPNRGRGNAGHYTELLSPRDLEEGLHADTDRSRSVSSERREFTEREIHSRLRSIEGGMRYIMQRLDNMRRSDNTDRPDNTGNNTDRPDNTGNNTGRRTWGDWYDTRWNSHISTLGGAVAPLSVVGTVYLLRPDLLTKAVSALGH